MANEKLTDWLKNAPNYGVFAPPMKAQTAIDFLRRYLLSDSWYSIQTNTEQINTEIVHEILLKYSREYRREWRKNGK